MTSAWVNRIRNIIDDVDYPPWDLVITWSKYGQPYLQVRSKDGECARTGERKGWSGRKWILSEHMSTTEVVKTALKAVLAAAEHEALERFTYKGKTIFNPHLSIEALLYASCQFELDGRPDPKPFECDALDHKFVRIEIGEYYGARYATFKCQRCGIERKLEENVLGINIDSPDGSFTA